MPGESTQPQPCSEMTVSSLMIKPAEARWVYYSAIKSFGRRSRPARARVKGAITTRSG